jgi:hypothetical protein
MGPNNEEEIDYWVVIYEEDLDILEALFKEAKKLKTMKEPKKLKAKKEAE